MTITIPRIIKVLGCIAAIVLAAIVLASTPGTHIDEICWGLIAVAVGVLVEAVVP
jgi:hypothetical protein